MADAQKINEGAAEQLVKGSEFTTVKDYDPKVLSAAYAMYLQTESTVDDIAIDLGIPAKVVGQWIVKGGWRDKKKEIEQALMGAAEDDYRALVIRHRVPTMLRHLKVTTAIEDGLLQQAQDIVEGRSELSLKDQTLLMKRVAEAMAASAGISGKAAGIEERPLTGPEGDKARPLIQLNINPTPTRVDTAVEVKEVPAN